MNEEKTFVVWVNEEDHLRLFSLQKDGDIGAGYKRLVSVSIGKSVSIESGSSLQGRSYDLTRIY